MVSARETGPTQKFMAIWRASKPVIAQVHGWCVGGASDYALCADIVIASEDAVIGTPVQPHVGCLPDRACGCIDSAWQRPSGIR